MDFFIALNKRIKRKRLLSVVFLFTYTVFDFIFAIDYMSSLHKFPFILFLLFAVGVAGLIASISLYRSDETCLALIRKANELSSAEEVGKMLEAMPKSDYSKYDLRYNDELIFYARDDYATIIFPSELVEFSTCSSSCRGSKDYCVCARTSTGTTHISAYSDDGAEKLCEMLKIVYAKHLEANENKKSAF